MAGNVFNYGAVAPRFRSRKAFVKSEIDYHKMDLERQKEDFKKRIDSLLEHADRSSLGRAMTSYSWLPFRYLGSQVLKSCEEESRLNLSRYGCFALQYYIAIYARYKLAKKFEALGKHPQKPAIGTPSGLGDSLMILSCITSKDQFHSIVGMILDIFDLGYVGGDEKSLTQLFVLRLAERVCGYTARDWASDDQLWAADPMKEEMLFASLWEHWNTDDFEILTPLLIQLLNRHTYQASRNNPDGGRDFGGPAMEQVPWELYFIFRMRDFLGLKNPEVIHRLTEPPFNQMPEYNSVDLLAEEDKEFLRIVLDYDPEFFENINRMKIRKWDFLF